MSTPAEEKGLVVGQSYRYQNKDFGPLDGKLIRFRKDDGSSLPAFDVPHSVNSEGWMYLSLENIQVPESSVSSLSVRVEQGSTMFIVGRVLTLAERAEVFNLLNSQGA